MYNLLSKTGSPMDWWPADSPFEIILGAILTQNTNWKNVEKALGQLKENQMLCAEKINQLSAKQLAPYIKSSGYYNQKAIKIKAFLFWFMQYGFKTENVVQSFHNELESGFDATKTEKLRNELLSIKGIGPETADSILCYAFKLPCFVVDAYTIRIFNRYNPDFQDSKYSSIQKKVETEFTQKWRLQQLAQHYNEFHALIVWLGSKYCKKKNPNCDQCPLKPNCQKNI